MTFVYVDNSLINYSSLDIGLDFVHIPSGHVTNTSFLFFPIFVPIIFFSYLFALARMANTVLNVSGDS